MVWGKDDYERSKSMAAQRMTRFQERLPEGEAFQSKGRLQPRWACGEPLHLKAVRGCADQDPALGRLTDRHALWPLPLPRSDINLLLPMERWMFRETVSLPKPGYPAEQRQDSDPGRS